MFDPAARLKWQFRRQIFADLVDLFLNVAGQLPKSIAVNPREHPRDSGIVGSTDRAKESRFARVHCYANVDELLANGIVNVAQYAEAVRCSHASLFLISSMNSAAWSETVSRCS